jgi:hypothetical protein
MASAAALAAAAARAAECLHSAAQALAAWAEPRQADLAVAASLAQEALARGELPADVPSRLLRTAAEAGALAATLLALLLSGRARAVARDVVDTLAAVALLLVMLGVLLGVPLGILYGLFRAGVIGAGAAVALVTGVVGGRSSSG